MARRASIILDEILEMIAGIEATVATHDQGEIQHNLILRLGIQRAIEIISEASRHIPQEMIADSADIPWRSVMGMGNILRHEYHKIADEVIWDVIQHDLPRLKNAVQALRCNLRE